MAERINEHDMTKRMMDVMRGGYKGLLSEADAPVQPQAPNNVGQPPAPVDQTPTDPSQPISQTPIKDDTIQLKPGDAAFNDELKSMRDIIDGSVVINDFNIYPTDRNVVIDGLVDKQEAADSGIFFKMQSTASDVEININGVELTDSTNEHMQRLKGYFSKFKQDWSARVNGEYQNGNSADNV